MVNQNPLIEERTDNTMFKRKKDKRTNNDIQSITQKTKGRETRISLKTVGKPRCSGRVRSSCSTSDTVVLL